MSTDLTQQFQREKAIPNGFGGNLGTSFDDVRGLESQERVLNEALAFTDWAMDADGRILLKTPAGRVLIELIGTIQTRHGLCLDMKHHRDNTIAKFTWMPQNSTTLWWTWFNKSTMSHLGDNIRNSPDKRVEFYTLLANN